MAKGYWISHMKVTDQNEFQKYVKANETPIRKYNGNFIARGGRFEVKKGEKRERHVIIEFPSFEDAKACYESEEYQAARKFQDAGTITDTILVEGMEK